MAAVVEIFMHRALYAGPDVISDKEGNYTIACRFRDSFTGAVQSIGVGDLEEIRSKPPYNEEGYRLHPGLPLAPLEEIEEALREAQVPALDTFINAHK